MISGPLVSTISKSVTSGTVLKPIGNVAKAKKYHEKALVIVTEIGERRGEGVCYVCLGNVFESLGECVMAEEYLNMQGAFNK